VTEAALLRPAELDEIDEEIATTIDRCVSDAKAAPRPVDDDLLTDVYATY
jgi:TPP-dependent pyruvate/acetoin dehydrogenase alpha subunit